MEIIILAEDETASHETSPQPQAIHKSAAGMLAKYRKPKLLEQEARAWELAVKEKYADH